MIKQQEEEDKKRSISTLQEKKEKKVTIGNGREKKGKERSNWRRGKKNDIRLIKKKRMPKCSRSSVLIR